MLFDRGCEEFNWRRSLGRAFEKLLAGFEIFGRILMRDLLLA